MITRVSRVSERDFDQLVSVIYEAALGSVPWDSVLPKLAHYLGGVRAAFGVRARGVDALLVLKHNFDPDLIDVWMSEFSGYDPWIERFADKLRPGELLHAGSQPFLAEMRQTKVYGAFFGPAGVDDVIATSMTIREGLHTYMGVYRARSEGLFAASDVARARQVTPHLVRAAAIHERIGVLGANTAATQALLESLPWGVLLLDGSGKLLWANRQGERYLRQDAALALREGALRARDAGVDAELQAACAAAARVAEERAAPPPGRVAIPAATGRRLEVLVLPLAPKAGSEAFAFTPRRARVAVVVTDPTAPAALPAEAIGELLQLPPALARLASALSAGKTVAEYAAEAGVTEGTARQQVKELLARGGVRRQADLIRILQRSVAALAN